GVLLRQAARSLDENRHCDRGTSDWLALLFNCEQHFDLYAHSARRPPLGRRDVSDLCARRQPTSPTAQGLHDAFRQLALAREPRGALMPCAVLCGFMREQPRRKPLHHCFVFNSAVWTLKPHCFRPDARQRRVVNVKVKINRLSSLRAPTNEITHRVPPISKRASAPGSPGTCRFGARGSSQSARPSD